MAAKDEVLENNKPAKGAPVIRQVEVAEEDVAARVLNRFIPALVISGAIHVVVIGSLVIFFAGPPVVAANTNDLTTTQVDEPKDDEKNLTNEEVGFDPDLAAATDAQREENVNVDAPATEEAVGLPDQPNDTAPQTAIAGLTQDLGAGSPSDLSPTGLIAPGVGGGGAAFTTPGMVGRSGATRDKLLKSGGGNTESEAAVARGLAWLARKQLKDGSWEFDGVSKDKIAATGMALLPFLAAGETHKYGTKYKETVRRGLAWLTGKMGSGGSFVGTVSNYSHAIATVALCEAAGMTKDPAIKAKATMAVGYTVAAQGRNGCWGYTGPAPSEGDTSIVGWQIQALASAQAGGDQVRCRQGLQEREPVPGKRLIGFGLEVWLSGQGGNADAFGSRSLEPVLHEGNESAASGVCSRGGLSQASAAAAEEQLRHVLLLLRDAGGAFLRRSRMAQVLESQECATCSSIFRTKAEMRISAAVGRAIKDTLVHNAANWGRPAWRC